MLTPCPHCQAEIEIDAATHAALAGQSHFACPACEGAVPVPAPVKVQISGAPGAPSRQPAGAPPQEVGGKPAASRHTNRNLLILGTAALLVLGGIGIYLASQKSGDTHNTNQNIRNEIINNSYFQNLIATGVTTKADLEDFEEIHAHGDGYIGVSQSALDWEQAHVLAQKTGSKVLPFEFAGIPGNHKIMQMFEDAASASEGLLRISYLGDSAVLTKNGTGRLAKAEYKFKTLYQWTDSQISKSSVRERPDMFDPRMPDPDGEGWLTLFDGIKLRGCSPSDVIPLRGELALRDGALTINESGVRIPIQSKNMLLRAELQRVGRGTLALAWRESVSGKKCELRFRHDAINFGVLNPQWRRLFSKPEFAGRGDYVTLEILAYDDQIMMKADGKLFASLRNGEVDEPGGISMYALGGEGRCRSLRVRMLDGAEMPEGWTAAN